MYVARNLDERKSILETELQFAAKLELVRRYSRNWVDSQTD